MARHVMKDHVNAVLRSTRVRKLVLYKPMLASTKNSRITTASIGKPALIPVCISANDALLIPYGACSRLQLVLRKRKGGKQPTLYSLKRSAPGQP